jgi:hypothetical protein
VRQKAPNIARLSHKDLGTDPPGENAEEQRLIIRVTPERISSFSV